MYKKVFSNNDQLQNKLQNQLLEYVLDDTKIFNKKFIPIINKKFTDKLYIGDTALTLACKLNKINQFEILISNGADINIGDQFNNTPLHIALEYNHYIIFGILLNKPGININAQNNDSCKKK